VKKTRHSEEQIIGVLKQMEAGPRVGAGTGRKRSNAVHVEEQVRRHGSNEVRRLKELEEENRRLKQLVADLSLGREALKGVIRKDGRSL
jgi:putative transposase